MITRALRLLPPEAAHNFTVRALQALPIPPRKPDPRLQVHVWGKTFDSPLGLAAGFDKQGQVMGAMLNLGLGFVEVGSVTPQPQPGNPKPRVFRAPAQRAVINRYGFNSDGHRLVHGRLSKWRRANPNAPLGINLGMNKGEADPLSAYQRGIETFEGLATYLVVNLSSPNTAGLRDQQTAGLQELIQALRATRQDPSVPLLIKVAPDLQPEQIELIAHTAMAEKLDGLIVSNTTLDRPSTLPANLRDEAGGLSGAPLRDKAQAALAQFYAHTQGALPLIGVGGISNGADALSRIQAGADLLQVYTGLMYGGMGLINDVERALLTHMEAEGVTRLTALRKTPA